MRTEAESGAVCTAASECPPEVQSPSPNRSVLVVYDAYDLYLQDLAGTDGMPEAPVYD